MATSYTANIRLQKPSSSDRNWDVPLNANADLLDGLTAVGGLAVTTAEDPSLTLNIAAAPGNFIKSDGTVVGFAGVSAFPVPASSTVYLWLTDVATLTSGPAFPASPHLRLARVVSGPTSVLQIADGRVQCSVAGTGLGFILKAGDTMTGALSVVTPGTNAALMVADPVNRLVGFFGAHPASQAPMLTSLATNSPGVASDTIADVGTTFSQSVLNNNLASLAAKVDALVSALKRHGLMGS